MTALPATRLTQTCLCPARFLHGHAGGFQPLWQDTASAIVYVPREVYLPRVTK